MADPFAAAAEVLHANDALGADAQYRSNSGAAWGATIRVVMSSARDAFGSAIAGRVQADVLATDATPIRDGQLRVGGATYVVESATQDETAATWHCTLASTT